MPQGISRFLAVLHLSSPVRLGAVMSKLGQTFRLMVPAGKATPQPPVGSALGQRGLNLMNFCKAFNDQTAHLIQGTPMQVARPLPLSPVDGVGFLRGWPLTRTRPILSRPVSHGSLSRLSLTEGSLTHSHLFSMRCLFRLS